MGDPYAVLGVERDADEAVVRERYRALLKEYHPDQGGSQAAFIRIRRAYEAVSGSDGRSTTASGGSTAADGGSAADGGPQASARCGGANADAGGAGARGAGADGGGGGATTAGAGAGGARTRSRGLVERGEYMTVVLRGLVEGMDLEPVVASHRADGRRRTVAFFDVRNRSDRLLPWRGHRHARFVGTDGYMYEGATHLRPHAEKLPPRWKGGDMEVEAGARLNGVVICQELPDGVDVARVAYTQPVFGDGAGIEDSERYVFDAADAAPGVLDEMPF